MASSSSGSERDGNVYVAEKKRRGQRRGRSKAMTLQEYFSTPETVLPQELIYGAMRVADSPTPVHQEAVGRLFLALHEHVSRRGLGTVWLAPLDVILDAERALVVQPDLFAILRGGAAIVADKVRGAPDLVIEVLSPQPRIGEVTERVTWFRDHGVRECWLVDQIDRRIDVLQFEDGQLRSEQAFGPDDPIESRVLPEFRGSLVSIIGY
jgi:Uma2 family endonuclease